MRSLPFSFVLFFVAILFVNKPAVAADDAILPKSVKGWGEIIDPKGDCSIGEKDGTLSMTLVGRHDLSAELAQAMDAPRVLRDIDGDFIAMIKVAGAFGPTGPSTVPSRRPFMGAGLLLWQNEKNYVRFERAAVDVDGETFSYLLFEERKNGEMNVSYAQIPLTNDPVRLRLERRNGKLYVAAAYDVQKWAGYPALQVELPARVRIGVAAISSSAVPFLPEFSEFEVYQRLKP